MFKFKIRCLSFILITFALSLTFTLKNSKQAHSEDEIPLEFIEKIKSYSSYDSSKLPLYYQSFLENENIIYTLNSINHPHFLDLSEKSLPAITVDHLTIVNPKYFVTPAYAPSSMMSLEHVPRIIRENEKMMLEKNCLSAYLEMLEDARRYGLQLIVFSSYRSYQKQTILYEKEEDKSYIAKPGHSEHQTGLAIDISTLDCGLTNFFENTSVYQYLKYNAYRFGFILRYPKEKTKITGYAFEPWHFRYVGKTHAKRMFEENLTLEEYIYYYLELN